jgi:hypothetical protein
MNLHKTNTRWLLHSWSTFGTKMSHEQTRIHMTHHSPDLGEATTFPPMCLSTRPTSKWHFVPGFLSGSLEIAKVGTPITLGAHNFAFRPLIEMRFKAKLYSSSRAFQQYVSRHLHTRKSGRFSTFNGWGSNCQFDS